MPSDINIIVQVVYPKRVTFKMLIGSFMAWLSGNSRWLLKLGWNIYIVDGE
jgi:hypothetical protein